MTTRQTKTLYSSDLIADAAVNLLSGNEQASDFRRGSWKSFSSKDGKTPLSSCKAVIVSDGDCLTICPAAGVQTVTAWKSGITGIVRITGSFEAFTGSADVVLKPPSGVEVIGCSCATANNKIPFDFIRRVAIGDEYGFLIGKSEYTSAAEVKVLLKATVVEVKKLKVNGRMFPANLPEAVWETFNAEGYTKPVTGIIYRNTPHPPSGLPMGGIDTGGLDIDTAGTLGYT